MSIHTDDHDAFDRPRKRSRPRTKDRPDYSKLPLGRVISIDRGRYRCLLDGTGMAGHHRIEHAEQRISHLREDDRERKRRERAAFGKEAGKSVHDGFGFRVVGGAYAIRMMRSGRRPRFRRMAMRHGKAEL